MKQLLYTSILLFITACGGIKKTAEPVVDNTPAWGMALTADTTNGGLAVTVTGAASTNIRWVATVNTSEVTYA